MPCTTLLVGKNASYDGSTLIARNEDSPNGEFTPKKFVTIMPEDQPRHYRSVLSHVEIDLPDNPMRYTSVPDALGKDGIWGEAGVNEENIAMSATETLTSNERVLGADPLVELQAAQGNPQDENFQPERPGGIGEEDMLTLVLPYIHSARDGVRRLGALLEEFGTYEMNGIAFSDLDEIWWLETVGGHHWIARRVPDDQYVVMPNQLGIDYFDLDDALGDQENFMCSADLREWIEKNHLVLDMEDFGIDFDVLFDDIDDEDEDYVSSATAATSVGAGAGKGTGEGDILDFARFHDDDLDIDVDYDDGHVHIFNPRLAFGSHSDADHVYNTPRAWAIHRYLNPNLGFDYSDDNWGPESDDLPWALEPAHKITVEDIKYALSLHYQGTAFDPYGTKGNAHSRNAYRPIGINRNGQLSVLQLRPYVPEACCAVQWMAYGSNPFNALTPFYANICHTPGYLANTTQTVTTESFYWANRLIAALADAHFRLCAAHIERYQQAVGAQGHHMLSCYDAKVKKAQLSMSEATPLLEQANAELASMLKAKTNDVLDKVLYEASMGMKNGFARSDG